MKGGAKELVEWITIETKSCNILKLTMLWKRLGKLD